MQNCKKRLINPIQEHPLTGANLSEQQIGNGLKQALDKGIKNQVSKLTDTDGFYKNKLVKILLPKELQAVN